MAQRLLTFAMVLGAIWMMGACGPQVLQVSEAQSNETVSLRVGSEMEISLAANPGTGYGWEVAEVSLGVLEPLGEPVYTAGAAMPGAPGVTTFRFRAVHQGESALRLVYRRPWEADKAPEKTFAVTVQVRP
ncbi:MAG: protease inhibitor I42 family protein [Chloroflexi bacterium]|nr:protease inhibitor I42 family protein [Chloroflexota bacterium]